MKLGIIGGGVVGKATARCFIEHVDKVRVWDKVRELSTATLEEVLDCELVFVCLPESQVEQLFCSERLTVPDGATIANTTNFVLRSTVPVGTTRRLAKEYRMPNLIHWPEFLTARCSLTDAQIPARNVIGWPKFNELGVRGFPQSGGFQLLQLLEKRFPGVPNMCMTSDESEAVKLIQNSFFATKVAFFNEAEQFCAKQRLDWDRVLAAVLADGRIAHSHTKVPGPDGKYGFGGACLPKDLEQWICCIEGCGQYATVARAARERNLRFDREQPVTKLEKDFLT